jgi:hypothetical protein
MPNMLLILTSGQDDISVSMAAINVRSSSEAGTTGGRGRFADDWRERIRICHLNSDAHSTFQSRI